MMDNQQFRQTRRKLGLSVRDLSEILNTHPTTIRRWEMNKWRATARPPNPIACQVLRWLESGELKIGDGS